MKEFPMYSIVPIRASYPSAGSVRRLTAAFGGAVLAASFTLGCAHTQPAAFRVRYGDLAHGAMLSYTGSEPLIVEFQAGDRLPVRLDFNSEDFELVPQHPPFEVVAKQHCFVRFGSDGIHTSLDPAHFPKTPSRPGMFHIGLNAQRGQQTALEISIVAPRR
jgi:hypothetical protein